MFDDALNDTIDPFLASGGVTNGKLVPESFQTIGFWYEQKFQHIAVNEGRYDGESIGLSMLYRFWYIETMHATMAAKSGAAYTFSDEEWFRFLTLVTIGWEKHARRMADTIVELINLELVDEPVPFEVLPKPVWTLAIFLFRDWHDVEWELEYEPTLAELGPLGSLFKRWREPDVAKFADALDAAADYHVQQCGYDEGDFAINDENMWLFPVELLAVCRLRQWAGLPVPVLRHALFRATPMGELPEAPRVPTDDKLQQVLDLYARTTGFLKPTV